MKRMMISGNPDMISAADELPCRIIAPWNALAVQAVAMFADYLKRTEDWYLNFLIAVSVVHMCYVLEHAMYGTKIQQEDSCGWMKYMYYG